jgi:hypothetical protein
MILRVVAIYERSNKIFAFILSLWVFQIIVSAVGLATGYCKCLPGITFNSTEYRLTAVPLPLGFVGPYHLKKIKLNINMRYT